MEWASEEKAFIKEIEERDSWYRLDTLASRSMF
jgi:hypothetical protein